MIINEIGIYAINETRLLKKQPLDLIKWENITDAWTTEKGRPKWVHLILDKKFEPLIKKRVTIPLYGRNWRTGSYPFFQLHKN
jgi:hypothetical protein